MTTDLNSKKCPYCAEEIKEEAIFCRFCGKNISPSDKFSSTPNYGVTPSTELKSSSFGIALASLIISMISLVVGLADLGQISNGTFAYLTNEEIGTLGILSLTGLGLGIAATVKKQKLWIGALSVSIASLVVMAICATNGAPTL